MQTRSICFIAVVGFHFVRAAASFVAVDIAREKLFASDKNRHLDWKYKHQPNQNALYGNYLIHLIDRRQALLTNEMPSFCPASTLLETNDYVGLSPVTLAIPGMSLCNVTVCIADMRMLDNAIGDCRPSGPYKI